MEAKDTVMSKEQIALAKNPILQENWVDFGQYVRQVTPEERKVAQIQAEISFKTGIREVVKWLKHKDLMVYLDELDRIEWKKKLKEWEIE